jgi:hypothetical protein
MSTDKALREHLLPPEIINDKAQHMPYTPWQVLEHMRIAQWDILEFSRNSAHVSPPWPEGYWPESGAQADEEAWNSSVEAFRRDLDGMKRLVEDPSTNLFATIAHGSGQTILREVLLVADHNSYHLGVLVTLKRLLQS